MKNKNYQIILKINNCPKCNFLMDRRKHKKNRTPKTDYYFSEWDYCCSCKHLQHYEKYKIKNNCV